MTSLLKGASVFTVGFGTAFIAAPSVAARVFDWAMFEVRGVSPPTDSSYSSFVYGVLGAVMMGWGGAMYMVTSSRAWRAGDADMWKAVAYPLALWFLADTSWSLHRGFWPNALLNCGFAAMFGVPCYQSGATLNESASLPINSLAQDHQLVCHVIAVRGHDEQLLQRLERQLRPVRPLVQLSLEPQHLGGQAVQHPQL